MSRKTKAVLILMQSGCLEATISVSSKNKLKADQYSIREKLFPIIGDFSIWSLSSADNLAEIGGTFLSEQPDLVILAFQTWGDDALLADVIKLIGKIPLVVWCYLPWRKIPHPLPFNDLVRHSGPAGTLGAFGALHDLKTPFVTVFGSLDDPVVLKDLAIFYSVATCRNKLKNSRLGLLPASRCENSQFNLDEVRLKNEIGCSVIHLDGNELLKNYLSVLAGDSVDYSERMKRLYPSDNFPSIGIEKAGRLALAIQKMARDYSLDLMCLWDNNHEWLKEIQIRPGLYPESEEGLKTVYQPEGDIGAGIANLILTTLTNSPSFYMEIWFWDKAKNLVIGGHMGVQNPRMASQNTVWIAADPEYSEDDPRSSTQMQFVAGPGRITMIQIRHTPEGWHTIATTGFILECEPYVEGIPHAVVRLDSTIEQFLACCAEYGSTENWIVVYGSVIPELKALMKFLEIKLELI